MNRTITRIAPIPAAKVVAIVYFVMGIVLIPFFLLPALLSDQAAGFSLFFAIAMPLFYAIGGFLGTALMCVLYNFAAARIGGIEFEVASDSLKSQGAA